MAERRQPVRHAVTVIAKRALEPLFLRLLNPTNLKRLRHLPSLPPWFRRKVAATRGPWPAFEREIPAALLTNPGIRRDPEAEQRAFEEEPLHSFHHDHGGSVVWSLAKLWQSVLPAGPRLMRAIARAQAAGLEPLRQPWSSDPVVLTKEIRDAAGKIGLSTIGIAPYDHRYTFADCAGDPVGDRVVVCVLEQNWPVTQTIPGPLPEQAALSTNSEVIQLATDLATALRERGYTARAHTTEGIAITHHYAVEAGIGQLGYNGQILTPQAGSRCRMTLVTTDAPLRFDAPRDFGVPGICVQCKACVRRCPAGAIPGKPAFHRGVEKSKLNLSRCFPVVAQVNGCAICMKVCPVQRYGLSAVLEHYEKTGSILGKETDELEGYDWPLDGRHYAPGERPFLEPAFFDVPGFGRFAGTGDHTEVSENPLM